MSTHDDPVCTAFAGNHCIATGSLGEVAATTKQLLDSGEQAILHVFHNGTSEPLDLDLRGSLQDVVERYASVEPQGASPAPAHGAPEVRRGPGRPRLGVVSKEVTLLPKHWAWLGTQPGGASATLRRLVHLARIEGAQDDLARQSQDAAYRFMYAMVANQPGFEEATRALFAGDAESFKSESEAWPPDLRDFSRRLASGALLAIEAP